MSSTEENFESCGFDIVKSFLSDKQVSLLRDVIKNQKLEPGTGGIREIDTLISEIGDFAKSKQMISQVSRYLSKTPELVRAIYFDKNSENNWLVSWHQDKTVTLSDKVEMSGWGPWSIKKGIHHVQPPLEIMEDMVTIRIHIDDAKKENGCLKVLPGSHKHGLIKTSDILKYVENVKPVYCDVLAGDAVVMRPHILHSSEKAKVIESRRILHFEYSSYELPKGLSWCA